jgi:hypothetical protein
MNINPSLSTRYTGWNNLALTFRKAEAVNGQVSWRHHLQPQQQNHLAAKSGNHFGVPQLLSKHSRYVSSIHFGGPDGVTSLEEAHQPGRLADRKKRGPNRIADVKPGRKVSRSSRTADGPGQIAGVPCHHDPYLTHPDLLTDNSLLDTTGMDHFSYPPIKIVQIVTNLIRTEVPPPQKKMYDCMIVTVKV